MTFPGRLSALAAVLAGTLCAVAAAASGMPAYEAAHLEQFHRAVSALRGCVHRAAAKERQGRPFGRLMGDLVAACSADYRALGRLAERAERSDEAVLQLDILILPEAGEARPLLPAWAPGWIRRALKGDLSILSSPAPPAPWPFAFAGGARLVQDLHECLGWAVTAEPWAYSLLPANLLSDCRGPVMAAIRALEYEGMDGPRAAATIYWRFLMRAVEEAHPGPAGTATPGKPGEGR